MDFLLEKFDDGSGVIRTAQEDTYDTYMEGANTFIGSYYVTALRASARMAVLMGDAPPCDGCGAITVRNGTCYKCMNCGNSMGCS